MVAIIGTRYSDFGVEHEALDDFGVEIVSGAGRTREEILALAADADVILAGAAPRFDGATIAGLRCKGIVRYGVGVDSIDLPAAAAAGILVANTPDYGTEAVAVHTLALVLAGIRRLPMAERRLRRGDWGFAELRPLRLPRSMTAGVVGFGRIGRRVGQLLTAVGFGRVLVNDPILDDERQQAGVVPLETLLATADVVTLHVPGDIGDPLIGSAELARMRPGSVLVNTARGSLIDTGALIDALAKGRPAVAALDVYPEEPPPTDRLLSEQLILTPHMAWYTEETELEMRRQAAAEARRLLQGLPPVNPVVPAKVDAR
jgi:D-3-phosphoglycerate dehydrogenase / 2-oxoglutarate reductase